MYSNCLDIPVFERWEDWEAAWPSKKQAASVHDDFVSRFPEFEGIFKSHIGLEQINFSRNELLQALNLICERYGALSEIEQLNEFNYPRELLYYSFAWYIGEFFNVLFSTKWEATERNEMNFPFPKVRWSMEDAEGLPKPKDPFFAGFDYYPFHQVGLVIKKGVNGYMEYLKVQVTMATKIFVAFRFSNALYLNYN